MQDVSQYFSQFGQVVGVRQVLWEDTGRKRGYGYVEMADYDQVGACRWAACKFATSMDRF